MQHSLTSAVATAFTPARLQAVLLNAAASETVHQTVHQDPAQLRLSTDVPSAAVVAILHENADGPAVLFIERATHENDPWSGHMAFPGGRAEVSDESSFVTAARETAEEIGVDITGAQLLGRLTDLQGGPRGTGMQLRVTPHVCWWHGERPIVALNHEVAATIWVPLTDLANDKRFIQYSHHKYPEMSWPGIELDDGRVVWGLTLRMLQDLFNRVGLPLAMPR